jgi:VanZ family protein
MSRKPTAFLHFAPALIYMGLIFYLSSRPAPAVLQHWPIWLDVKLVHVVEYGLMALLWIYGFLRATELRLPCTYAWTIALTFVWGVADEVHQSFNPDRTGRTADALTDLLAAIICVLLHLALTRFRPFGFLRFRRPAPPPGESTRPQ